MDSKVLQTRQAADSAAIIAALHTRIVPPLAGTSASFEERVAWLGEEVCAQLDQVMATAPSESWMHIICTTCLSTLLSGREEHADALFDLIEKRCSVRPVALLHAYQCTGWGYALRFAGQHTDCRHLAISIVDADVHDALATGFQDAIGKIGYGVSTIGIELPDRCVLPQCGGPFPNRAFGEFLHAIRALRRQPGHARTFIPFLTEGLAGIAQRLIGNDNLAPNRHAYYGHSFGADPWIGLIEWLQAHPLQFEQIVTLGAFAYDGYFTACNFLVRPSTTVGLKHFEPYGEPLHHMAEFE